MLYGAYELVIHQFGRLIICFIIIKVLIKTTKLIKNRNRENRKSKSTLAALREKGIKLAIGSSSRNAKYILERIALSDYFDAVSDGTNISKSKPDPEVFLKAAEFLGLKPEECLVVEDAIAGVDAAHAGRMKAAVVGDAARRNYGDYILEAFDDLLEII